MRPEPGPHTPRPGPDRLVLLFVDGVGIGVDDPDVNPFLRAELPVLRALLGGGVPTLEAPVLEGPRGRTFPLDACLGVPGTPQSGTGQVALLTGRNAPALFGRHFGPWPPVALRPLLAEWNVLRSAVAGGATVAFANAYPRGYPEGRSARRVAAPALAAKSAGLLTRHHEALARGEAVAADLDNEAWRRHLGAEDLPAIDPTTAGRNLARIADAHELTFFAHFDTDLAGHRGGMAGALRALDRLDAFLGGLLDGEGGPLSILLVSDHGNLEDVRTGHTRHPALGAWLGDDAAARPPLDSLLEVRRAILEGIGRPDLPSSRPGDAANLPG